MNQKTIRLISFLTALVIIFSLIPLSSFAAELTTDYTEQENLAIEYLTKSAENEWLFKNNKVEKYVDEESEGGFFALNRTSVLKEFRKLNEAKKENFKAEYLVEFSGPREFDVLVRLVENISFTMEEKDYHYNNTYIITINDENKIIDVNKINDWFETAYRYSGKTKEIIFSELTKELVNNIQPNVAPLKERDVFASFEGTDNIQYMMYDPQNAVNYALTYSGESNAYYNTNFKRYDEVGGDCMNFASQSMWAGLGGSNHSNFIEEKILFNNHNPEIHKDSWVMESYPWVGVWGFYQYITNETPKNNGLVAKTWRIEADQWDLGIEEDLLLGSIALVPGDDPEHEFGHAVVITEVNGTTREQIKYSGHTTDAHQASFSKAYSNVPIIIVRPIYYKLTHNCFFDGHLYHTLSGLITGDGSECVWCGYKNLSITNKLMAPITIGETAILASKASMNVFKMSIKVESPTGEVTWLRDEYNTNFIKRQHTFIEPGLYKITTYAQDTNDILSLESNEIESTYYVRVMDSTAEIGTGESEYVDPNYFDDELEIDFVPNYNMS